MRRGLVLSRKFPYAADRCSSTRGVVDQPHRSQASADGVFVQLRPPHSGQVGSMRRRVHQRAPVTVRIARVPRIMGVAAAERGGGEG